MNKALNKSFILIILTSVSLNLFAAKSQEETQATSLRERETQSKLQKIKKWIEEHKAQTVAIIAITAAAVLASSYAGYRYIQDSRLTPEQKQVKIEIEKIKKEDLPKLKLVLRELTKNLDKLVEIKKKYVKTKDKDLLKEAYKLAPKSSQAAGSNSLSEDQLKQAMTIIGGDMVATLSLLGTIEDVIKNKKQLSAEEIKKLKPMLLYGSVSRDFPGLLK